MTLCLNMIVKNESAVIRRCLGSVKPWIDRWAIVDTGSTDNTQTLLIDALKGIPGELYAQPWFDFSTNRNGALSVAKGKADYVFFIDADEILVCAPDFRLPRLTFDLYLIEVRVKDTSFYRPFLANNRLDWVWRGVIHECLYSPVDGRRGDILKGAYIRARQDGCRNEDPERHRKDAALLEKALQEDPENTRYLFFLAQSYYLAGEWEKGIATYRQQIARGGSEEEIYFSHYMIAKMEESLGKLSFLESYWRAYRLRPRRAEPLYWIGFHYLKQGRVQEAYDLARKAMQIPLPDDHLNVEKSVYDYGLRSLVVEAAGRMGRSEEALQEYAEVLSHPSLSEEKRQIAIAVLAPFVKL